MEKSLVRKRFVWGQGGWRRREGLQGKRKRSNDQMILKMQSFISLKGNTQWTLQSLLGPKLRLFSALRFSSNGRSPADIAVSDTE